MKTNRLATACGAILLAGLAPAWATFHLMKVVQVFPGTAAAPDAQYVVLQMYASGQNLVGGHALVVFNAAGTAVGTFTFGQNVANGANQARILIATSQAQAFFGITPDLLMTPALIAAGGKVCWAGTIDCVAWGAYTGGSTGVGTPYNASHGLVSGQAALRRLDISGSASALDAGDDTNNSATDFLPGTPAPRNNAGSFGSIPMATCGNGVIEGLEQCDDHNLANGDGCSSVCQVDAVTVVRHPVGDFDGDGRSDIVWRNTSTGGDVIWRAANYAAPLSVTGVTGQTWHIVGRGDFNGDGKADLLWRDSASGANTIWLSANSATRLTVTAVAGTAWQVAGVGDFTGDGVSDILWRNTSTGANVIWGNANSAKPQAVATVNLGWRVVGVADFNGDKKADIFWRNTSSGANAIWKSGNGATPQTVTGVTDSSWRIVAVGDFNGDGKADVFWRHNRTGANTIWISAISSTLQATAGVTDQDWQVATSGDFDGDGKDDVAWRNLRTGADVIWKSGNGSTPQAMTAVTALSWTIVPYEAQPISP